MIIAIQSDDFAWPKGAHPDASAPRWAQEIKAAGHEVRWVDVYRPDILEQLNGCRGFMWRHAHVAEMRQIARRLLPVIERDLRLAVYPDQQTCWHYDDKIIQSYLFEAYGIPAPKTWVWYDRNQAIDWCNRVAEFPIVAKLWAGAGSVNVKLIGSAKEAEHFVKLLFDRGAYALEAESPKGVRSQLKRLLLTARSRARPGAVIDLPDPYWDVHHRYALFQQWLPGNAYDTRITVIGNRAFGFRRFNRAGDFRASGSNQIDWDPDKIDPEFVRLAFKIAQLLSTQSLAMDGLYRGDEPVACEISYTYSSKAVHQCPGHWQLSGDDRECGELQWHEGQTWPEAAQIQDFLQKLEE